MHHRKQLVLIGAGHAHLHIFQHVEAFTRQGIGVTLVDPGAFWYSGMATGMLGGQYACDQDRLDAGRVIEQRGGRFVQERVVGLDVDQHHVITDGGDAIRYDAASFNIGSEVPVEKIPGAAEHAWPVKPIAGLCQLRERLITLYQNTPNPRVVVVGGGATGCEIAANVHALASRHHVRAHVTLCSAADRLIPAWPAGAARALERELRSRGIDIEHHCRIARCPSDHVLPHDGRRIHTNLTILATGLRGPRLLDDLPLARDPTHGLRVNAALQSIDDPDIFAAGDCIHFDARPLPKVGVYGVRAGPILRHNLLAQLTGRPLRPFHPQRRYLIILNLGHGRALAMRGRGWWIGRWPLRLKHWIDRRFMRTMRCGR